MSGLESGKQLWTEAFSLSVARNSATEIPGSNMPWMGVEDKDVLLYRITTYSNRLETESEEDYASFCRELAFDNYHKTHTRKRGFVSISEYWLSNFTDSAKPQDLSALGEWRENVAHYVWLVVDATWCDCMASMNSCSRAGCSTSDMLVRITNNGTVEHQSPDKSFDAIAFAVSVELHFADRKESEDTRVLPTFYSDGLFSILKDEERSVCVSTGPGSRVNGERLELQVTAWNAHQHTVRVPSACREDISGN